MTNGEMDGELLKHLTFEYALKLTGSEVDYNSLTRFAQEYRSGLYTYMLPQAIFKGSANDLPFMQISGGLSYSALKPAQDLKEKTVILRLVNLSDEPQQSTVELASEAEITPVNLAEEVIGGTVKKQKFTVDAAPWQIQTVMISFVK